MNRARHWATLLLAAGLALALASNLTACDGSPADDHPPTAATETPAPPAVPIEPPVPATPAPLPEMLPTTLEAPIPEPPAEPVEPSVPVAASITPLTQELPTPAAARKEAEPSSTTLFYDSYDLGGEAATPGSYAFLFNPTYPDEVISIYEWLHLGLRRGARLGLLIHQADRVGTSQAAFYNGIDVGDLVEWREAGDCWVRYTVTEVKPDPEGGAPRKLLAIRPYAYAATGCSGTFATAVNRATGAPASGAVVGTRAFTWSPVPIRTGNITIPIQHGPFLLAPRGWSGALPERDAVEPISTPWPPAPMPDPDLGPGWTGGLVDGDAGLEWSYSHESGGSLSVNISQLRVWPLAIDVIGGADDAVVNEYRIIAGRPARISYDRVLRTPSNASILIYDPASGVVYTFTDDTASQRTDPEALIALARQFLPPAEPADRTACRGVECIEPVIGAFEHRTYPPGERIEAKFRDFLGAAFFLDVETGGMESYWLTGSGYVWHALPHHRPLPTGWVTAYTSASRQGDLQLLLRRETGETWRWPMGGLQLLAISSEYLLFEERKKEKDRPDGLSTGRFILLNTALEPVAQFSVTSERTTWVTPHAFFSPDGQTILLVVDARVYRIPVAAPHPELLSAIQAPAGWEDVLPYVDARYWGDRWTAPGMQVDIRYSRYLSNDPVSYESHTDTRYFTWAGASGSGPACHGTPSPDGRYVAQQDGGQVWYQLHSDLPFPFAANPWPSVIVADAATCEPLFRVRSAYTRQMWWRAGWLSNSEGFVIGVADGYRIARVGAAPELVPLPRVPDGVAGSGGSPLAGPVPAPTGGGRYFAYDLAGVYDMQDDRWIVSGFPSEIGPGMSWAAFPSWGENHHEVRYSFLEGHASPGDWLLLPPEIEFPPFSDEGTFRVARTASCLRLREGPGSTSPVKDCLADGERLMLAEAERSESPYTYWQPHPGVSRGEPASASPWWIYIRTEEGTEGWVSLAYLDHDIAHRRAFDPTGAVSEPGDYAFLSDPDDLTSAVYTYEELRDGTTTALLIHTHDAHGISQAARFDAVAPGDLFEWRQAADCFVRYQVTEVKPDPTGTVPQKLLGVAWMTYAFTGCTGAIATTTAATLDWAELHDLGGTSLTVPVRHGPFQLVPEGWTGETEARVRSTPPAYNRDNPVYATTLAAARQLPYWREPAVPSGLVLLDAEADPEQAVYGYSSAWVPASRQDGVHLIIAGGYVIFHALSERAAWRPNGDDLGVRETRVIAGRPAQVIYSPAGSTHQSGFPATVWIYDPATNAVYSVHGVAPPLLGNVESLITIGASLFEPPNPP